MRISDWSSDVCSSDLHFRIAGLYVDTNRDEDETSITLGGEDLEFDGIETQHEDIHQQTYAITSDAALPLSFAELGFAAGWSGYREDPDILELGRASWQERVCKNVSITGIAETLK